jgi:hypothetical protein
MPPELLTLLDPVLRIVLTRALDVVDLGGNLRELPRIIWVATAWVLGLFPGVSG